VNAAKVEHNAYEALLLLSFGGPEGPEDVLPFLRNVTRGRGIPDERLAEVGEHYAHFGGVSPINAQNRALIAALGPALSARGVTMPIYWGNRNWAPYVKDAVAQMRADAIRSALVFATSATGSYSACRQYRENLADAVSSVGEDAPTLVKLPHYSDRPGFIAANVDAVRAALAELPEAHRDAARLVFTAHSIPTSMNDTSGPQGGLYAQQQHASATLVAEAVRGPGAEFDLVWQSRSGPPQVPWLEPDINDHLRDLAEAGRRAVVVSPIGFVSDHLEVLWDLDNEAKATAENLGMFFARAACAGTHPAFVDMICDLVIEQLQERDMTGISGWNCPATCCPAPARRPN